MAIFSRGASRKLKRKKSNSIPLLSTSFQRFIAHRLTDLGGFSFIAISLCLGLSLISFHPKDPSFNTVSISKEIHNYFGKFGAYTADMFLQTLGLAAYLFVFAFLVWGIRIILRKPLGHLGFKIPLLITSVFIGAIVLARVPAFETWHVGAYLGGSAGALLFTNISNSFQSLFGTSAFIIVNTLAFLFFVPIFLSSLGITLNEWKSAFYRIYNTILIVKNAIVYSFIRTINWHRHHTSLNAIPTKPLRTSLKEEMETKTPSLSLREIRKPIISLKAKKKKVETRQKKLDFKMNDNDWQLPTVDFLDDTASSKEHKLDEASLQKNAELLQATLRDFGIEGDIVKVHPGPIVTLYEMEPSPGTKTSRVIGLSDDIARSMSAISVRVAVIPGKNAIGIELPNTKREIVHLKEMLASQAYEKNTLDLPLTLGKDIGGDPVIVDLARMPHLLVAGTTGSGKSVAVNTMILSLLYRMSPEQCRFIMIDPKMLELSVYDDIPHLLTPVVTEANRAVTSLKWAVREMEDRYRAMSKLGVRNINGFNERIREACAKGEVLMHKVQTGFDSDTGKPLYEEQPISQVELPYIVIIVDEFADLMLVAGKEVENAIQRLAQMARAAGIHLIMATQRPSVDVITGVIKANFPTRISFQVTSKIDSRTILGEGGAEQLLGRGDMLYMASGGRLKRVHGPFVTDDEVERVVKHLRAQGTPVYIDGVTEDDDSDEGGIGNINGGGPEDVLYDKAVQIIMTEGKVSTSFIQRHLQIGYNRAARIVERMEKEGLISEANHAGKRQILVGNYGT